MDTLMALVLVLRVFDRSGDSAESRQAAMLAADSILREADVTATWIDCTKGAQLASHAACTDPLGSGELAIRITEAPREDAPKSQRALGYSLVEPEVGGTLATIFSDRVAWLAATSDTRYTALLGRAVAHEIGHLVIGTSEHSPAGLMRAIWTSEELVRDEHNDWLFTADDRSRLQQSRFGQLQWQIADSGADGIEETADEL
jgi:hypothetical protein